VLAESGLIQGRRVTPHWAFAAQLAERYPDIDVADQNMVLDDGDILSAASSFSKFFQRISGQSATEHRQKFGVGRET